MKAIVIGVGSVGSVIAKSLADEKSIEELTLVDKDIQNAEDIRRNARNSSIIVRKLDATKEDELATSLKGKDLVVNSGHPAFNEMIMRLCLRLHVNYVDLANWNIMSQLSHHSEWESEDLLAVVGLGEDPGLSNIYARFASDNMVRVRQIRVRDGEYTKLNGKINGFISLFSPAVFFAEIFQPSIVFRNGTVKRMPPFSGREIYDFGPPIGKQTVYLMNHEEVETLPKYIGKGTRFVDFKLALEDDFVEKVTLLEKTGMLSKEAINVNGIRVSPFDVFIATIPPPYSIADKISGHAGIAVEVQGTDKKNRKARCTVSTSMSHAQAYKRFRANATSFLTGIVPAVFAANLGEGRIRQRGVIPAEALDPQIMLHRLAKAGVKTKVNLH